jgi:hypothetical protein
MDQALPGRNQSVEQQSIDDLIKAYQYLRICRYAGGHQAAAGTAGLPKSLCQLRRLFSLTPTAVAAALNEYRSSVTRRTASRLKSSEYCFPLTDCGACSATIGTGFLLMANSF